MKKIAFSVITAAAIMASSVASAGWFGSNNNGWNNGYDDNDWPEWTPMYWMEEMMDEWDNDDDDDYYRYGGYGYAPRGYAPSPYYPAPAVAPRAPAPAAPTAQ
ncbi:MAG: hypothetical protein H8D24_04820 [Gammaproteobacteria bacterium]|uniref:Sulfur globule protein CV1 n=1 Tax=Candidatus Thiopontia autotrophica TaxID=2841688 RepID=A0A8J6PDX0_9GAMM|nr:hypothetical protein [Candidatus Thiopontia autotrophica]MBL6968781.1 hypothetical protein [Gammaproteobacteria bacterium]